MNLLNAIRDWADPLPPAETAKDVDDLQNKLRAHASGRHDIVVTRVPSPKRNEQGHYRITPVRSDCCWTVPATDRESREIQETKSLLRAELEQKLNKLRAQGSTSPEEEIERKKLVASLKRSIQRIDASLKTMSGAPLDHEYFQHIFSQHGIEDATESEVTTSLLGQPSTPPLEPRSTPPSEEKSSLQPSGTNISLSRSAAARRGSHFQKISSDEIERLVLLINTAKNTHNLGKRECNPNSRKAAFDQRLALESSKIKQLVQKIRNDRENNWIDSSFENDIPMTADAASLFIAE